MATIAKTKKDATTAKATASTTATPAKKKTIKKIVKASPAQADSKNLKDTVKKEVTSEREVKYIYPADVAKDQGKKKEFRAKARGLEKSFLKRLSDAEKGIGSEKVTKVKQEHKAWRETVFLVP